MTQELRLTIQKDVCALVKKKPIQIVAIHLLGRKYIFIELKLMQKLQLY